MHLQGHRKASLLTFSTDLCKKLRGKFPADRRIQIQHFEIRSNSWQPETQEFSKCYEKERYFRFIFQV